MVVTKLLAELLKKKPAGSLNTFTLTLEILILLMIYDLLKLVSIISMGKFLSQNLT